MIAESTALSLNQIRTDGGTQSRAQLNWIIIDEYAKAMMAGDDFPPVVVFYDGVEYWLADGFHRLRAAEYAKLDCLPADIRQGTVRDAILYSVGANDTHGLRRTNEDKRNAVEMLLKDAVWVEWSDPKIAQVCGVSHNFVRERRAILHPMQDAPAKRKVTRKGRTYTQDTSNIGKRKPAPESKPEPPQLPLTDKPIAPEPEAEPEPAPPIVVHHKDAGLLSWHTSDVHLVITSPPYNVGIDYASQSDDLGTYLPMITNIWRECYKVMVEGARIAVVVPFGVGRNPYIPFDCQIMQTLIDAGFTLRGRIIWDKNTTGNRTSWGSFRMASSPAIRDTTECIIVAHKGDGKLAIPPEHIYQDADGHPFMAWLAESNYFMGLAQDHWVVAPESAQRVKHPAPFPEELVKRLVHFYGYPGCHILDPFAGSGTVGVVAKQLGCRATLFEISQEYCNLARERIDGN